jgi:membrane protein implicated in regulation of membrane protease activity
VSARCSAPEPKCSPGTSYFEAGQVKLAGDVWSARSLSEHHEPIAPGTSVTVVEISGATAVVAAEP